MRSNVVYIGQRLKEIRIRRLMSQRDLAEAAGLSHSAIVKLEANRSEPHPRTLRKLVGALHAEPEDLLGE